MLLDNSVFEEPFEQLQLSKNDVGAFEQLPNGSSRSRVHGLSNAMAFPMLDAPYNLLDKVNETPFKGPTQHSISTRTAVPTSHFAKKQTSQPTESAPSSSFDPWLELQKGGHKLAPSTNNCTSWESFALNAADTLKMRSKPQLKSPFLSELSLDHFQRVEESYKQSTDYRYAPESLITHQYLIKDTIQLLLGAPSNLFEFDVDKQTFVPRIPNIRTMGIGSKGLNSIIDRFVTIGNQMARLEKIINTNKYRSRSSVAMAFVDCLADYHTYLQQSLLAMVEKIGGIQKVSIMELYHSMEDICYVLDELVKLCDTSEIEGNSVSNSKAGVSGSSGELPNGAELLDIIFKKVKSLDTAQSGCTYLLRSILSAFLTTSSAPYFTLILGWLGVQPGEERERRSQQTLLYDHNLQTIDPHNEFFVQATKNAFHPSSSAQEYSTRQSNMSNIPDMFSSNTAIHDGDHYWYSSFQLRDSLRPCFISDELALDILETGKSLRLLKDLFPVDGPSLNDYIKHFIDQDHYENVLPSWKFKIAHGSQSAKATACVIPTDSQQHTEATLDMEMFANSNQLTFREKHACDDSFMLPSPKRQRHNTHAKPDTPKTLIAQELSLPEIISPPTPNFIKLLEDFQICGFAEQHEAETAAHMPPLDVVTAASVDQPLSRLCRSLNTSVMAYFFKDLQLLQYLQALQDYFTFKNGDFYSNAMDALFRSDLDEDQPGGLVTIGLPKSIKSRRWPPSSIDLNIALKDVLLNSYSNFDNRDFDMARNNLSVGEYISFSVRENMDNSAKWTNPQSLEAVDFLQLSYSPPYPLNIVITPTIIEKYNRVFSFLLRLFRVRRVVQNMHKCMQARRGISKINTNAYLFIEPVRFQFAQFVDALHGYVMDAVITSNWKAYMRHLEAMANEATQTNNDEHSANDTTGADLNETIKLMMDLDTLRTYNEYFVELLLHQCILKRKQQGILRIIETLLGSVLALAALISDFDAVCYDNREPTENEIRKLHRHCTKIQNRFHSQMKTLVAILASLQARDSGDIRFSVDQRRLSKLEVFAKYYEKVASADGAVNCYERLLLRLDFNGYYQDVQ